MITATGEVHLEKAISASRDALFRACSTRDGLEGWYADAVRGDLRPGESVRLEWPEVGAALDLGVKQVSLANGVVLESGSMRVTLKVGEGIIRLWHHGIPEASLEGLRSSWAVALALLGHGLEKHPGRPRTAHWEIRPVRATPEMLHLCFTQKDVLELWLGASSGIGKEGEHFWLSRGRDHLSGTVLAHTEGRDVALSVTELGEAFLSLRTLPASAPGSLVALSWSTWGPPGNDAGRSLRPFLSKALDRLVAVVSTGGSS